MKKNVFYTTLQSHRKTGFLLFWGFGIFIGCFCFPFANITSILSDSLKQISIINFFICVLAYAEIGLLSGYLFDKKKAGIVLLINMTHMVAGMLARYFLEFGEVSNTYNFTLPNMVVHVIAASCICFCGYLSAKKQMEEG